MTPKRMTKDEFLKVLDFLRSEIVADDSANGTLSYEITPEKHVFSVTAAIHTDFRLGQGSTTFICDSITDEPPPEPPPVGKIPT